VYYCILSIGYELTSIPVVDTEQPFQHQLSSSLGRPFQLLSDIASTTRVETGMMLKTLFYGVVHTAMDNPRAAS
jgi:hypothetical protein